jgi:Mor family transcriptional regulator
MSASTAAASSPAAQSGTGPGGEAYPEVLRVISDAVARQLLAVGIDSARATAIGEAAAEQVRDLLGGQLVYVPKGRTLLARRRYEQIYAEFTGDNHADLARRHGLGIQQLYRVIAIMRREHTARVQGGLFDCQEPPLATPPTTNLGDEGPGAQESAKA